MEKSDDSKWSRYGDMPKPPRIGGLATPLGVYMTSGYYDAGAGWKGLVATGVLFGVVIHLIDFLGLVLYSAITALFPFFQTLGQAQQAILQFGSVLMTLLLLLRFSPLAGLHAAEHMTINAIENNVPLTEQVVRTQPREHQRCGTNLMSLLVGFQLMGISFYVFQKQLSPIGLGFYLIFWLSLIFKFWRPAGFWLQRHFTTKPPTSAQLASGLKAGKELLEKFEAAPHPMPNLAQRFWGAGFIQMGVAFLLTAWLVGFLLEKL